jgi:hypothetical protein
MKAIIKKVLRVPHRHSKALGEGLGSGIYKLFYGYTYTFFKARFEGQGEKLHDLFFKYNAFTDRQSLEKKVKGQGQISEILVGF